MNGVVFIDLRKVFDTIDHNILLSKLSAYGVNDLALSFYFDPTSADERSGVLSICIYLVVESSIATSVPHGSIIRPLLFLVYINDLPNWLNKGFPSMFADDTNISVSASSSFISRTVYQCGMGLVNL